MEPVIVDALAWTRIALAAAVTFSSITAFIAVCLSIYVIRRNSKSRRADIHSRFQSDIRSIQQNFTASVNDPENWKPTDVELRYIRLYWYAVFDEWLITHKEDTSLIELWNNYYSLGVASGLKNSHFADDLKRLFAGQSALFGYRSEFAKTINELYAPNHEGNNLIELQ